MKLVTGTLTVLTLVSLSGVAGKVHAQATAPTPPALYSPSAASPASHPSLPKMLATERFDSLTRIDVTTTQVSLSGSVESEDARKRAEDLARQIAGVRRVDNNLQVRN